MLHILSGAQVTPLTWLLLTGHVVLKGEESLSSARGGPLPREAPPYSLSPFLLPRSPDMARLPVPAPLCLWPPVSAWSPGRVYPPLWGPRPTTGPHRACLQLFKPLQNVSRITFLLTPSQAPPMVSIKKMLFYLNVSSGECPPQASIIGFTASRSPLLPRE